MKIEDALHICIQFNGQLLTGEKGLNRNVRSIEVMEVPEVDSWVREDLLVITTFYAVQDNVEAQSRIIQTLIERKAAGMIVKLGRFIDSLPKEIVHLAKEEEFPIILLPKDVPYVEILDPLYIRLHQKKMLDEGGMIWGDIDEASLPTIEACLDLLASKTQSAIYIEDLEGRLLSKSQFFIRDGWRKSSLLFSLPFERNYVKQVEEWKKQLSAQAFLISKKPGRKNRLLIPLRSKGEIIAFIHFVSNELESFEQMNEGLAKQLMDKIYITMMSEMIEIQQQRLIQNELLNERIEQEGDRNGVVLYFQQDELAKMDQKSFIDYHGLFRKKLAELLSALSGFSDYFLFDRKDRLFALLIYSNSHVHSTLTLKKQLSSLLEESPLANTTIAISSVFQDGQALERQLEAVIKIIDLGKEVYPQESVYSYNKLGIYEMLIKLSGDQEVKQYVDGILKPLYDAEPVLLETLIVYLQENGNASSSAEKLFVNRRTITNRLQKIKEILDTDLDDAENVFILQFCLRIKNLV